MSIVAVPEREIAANGELKLTKDPLIGNKNPTWGTRIRDSDAACFYYPSPFWGGTMWKLFWTVTAVTCLALPAAAPDQWPTLAQTLAEHHVPAATMQSIADQAKVFRATGFWIPA